MSSMASVVGVLTPELYGQGGWVIGDLHEDPSSRRMCNQCDAVVVSVDYRLAPETRFPGAAEDCYVRSQRPLSLLRLCWS